MLDEYFAVPYSATRVADRALIAFVGDAAPVRASPVDMIALRACVGLRPLAQHCARVWATGQFSTPDKMAGSLERLIEQGALRPRRSLPAVWPHARTGVRPEVVVFITADRPESLARSLVRARKHFHDRSRPLPVLVVDGSVDEVVSAAATERHCVRIGRANSQILIEDIVAGGVPRAVAQYALSPGPIGANRNLALLLTTGRAILMCDDDVLLTPWRGEEQSEAALVGHVDARRWEFFSSRRDALNLVEAPVSVSDEHGAFLGASLGSVIEGSAGSLLAFDACSHLLSAWCDRRDMSIVMTFSGLAGDSARHCSHSVLFRPGPVRDLLRTTPSQLTTALRYREARIIAERPLITHESGCMSYCMGVDNRRILAPFLPVGRGEDTVFGAVVMTVAPDALAAHIPVGICHDSHRDSSYGDGSIPSASGTRLSEIVTGMVAWLSRLCRGTCDEARTAWLGRALQELAEQSTVHQWQQMVWEITVERRATSVAELHRSITVETSCQEWVDAIHDYSSQLAASVVDGAFRAPSDVAGDGPTGRLTRRAVADYGRVLQWWPRMREVAVRSPAFAAVHERLLVGKAGD